MQNAQWQMGNAGTKERTMSDDNVKEQVPGTPVAVESDAPTQM